MNSDESPANATGATDTSFLESVLGTVFKNLGGGYISKVGDFWRDKESVVIITAWNPNFSPASANDNERQNQLLQECLKGSGKQFEEVLACWPNGEGFERSFAVAGMADVEAHALCVHFAQAAYFRAEGGRRIELVSVGR